MYDLSEEEIVSALSEALKIDDEEEIDGLDEILPYVSGLLSTRLQELELGDAPDIDEILEESMIPFLESVGVPVESIEAAKTAMKTRIESTASTATATVDTNPGQTQKLTQSLTMSSVLQKQTNDRDDGDESMWSKNEKIKPNANTQIEAYSDKTSAREKRKQRQELEKSRKMLEQQNQRQETSTKAGVSAMILPTVKGKEMDVNVQRISLSLENGTSLLEQGDLKFAYQRRYAIIGENGVGKYILSL